MIQNNGLDFWDTNLNYEGGHGSQKRRFVLYRDKFWLLQSTEIPCGTVAVNTAGAIVPCFNAQGGSLTFLWCPDSPGEMLGMGIDYCSFTQLGLACQTSTFFPQVLCFWDFRPVRPQTQVLVHKGL